MHNVSKMKKGNRKSNQYMWLHNFNRNEDKW